ncbi:hypothetical protein ACFL51_01535 [Myxococcota bacterium]
MIILASCVENSPGDGQGDIEIQKIVPQSVGNRIDILFVIDNTSSMLNEPILAPTGSIDIDNIRLYSGELPDVHIGVVSTDLGVGSNHILGCTEYGDDGRLKNEDCLINEGGDYLINVEPLGCEIDKEMSNGYLVECTSHSCSQQNCEFEPNTTLHEDEYGCPRCHNYISSTYFEETIICMTNLGVSGCEYPQPLEAMYKALKEHSVGNLFLREDAFLAVIFISDSDDCSTSDTILFNGDSQMLEYLGPLTEYRCFEFGVTCEINDRNHVGLRQSCAPRTDDGALLHPVERYVEFLRETKSAQLLAVFGISGPVDNNSVTVTTDEQGNPNVQNSCEVYDSSARPGIRLKAVIEQLAEEQHLETMYRSVCVPDMSEIYYIIERRMLYSCLEKPIKGCADVGVEYDSPQSSQTCEINSRCLPQCVVFDIFMEGTDSEQWEEVPHCLEIMSDGGLEAENTDRTLAYAEGRPTERDAGLPVKSCWYIGYNPACSDSNYSEIVIARREDPPSRTFSEVTCMALPHNEESCNDGVDNDEDCEMDEEDSDCMH